ncbi:flagellin, partial [Campylobacter hyointestinalis]|uniref:flagellin n=1 Tax=Campylobacter hyointestinalis TaxID=198 RepID=UPI000DCDE5E8
LSAAGGDITVKLSGIDGFPAGYTFKAISKSALQVDGFKTVADQINAMTAQTGVRASVNNVQVMSTAVTAGNIKNLQINGVLIGDITVKAGDDGNILTAAINAKKDETGVEASIDKQGKLTLATKDGRAIRVKTFSTSGKAMGGPKTLSNGVAYLGQLTFTRQDARDIKVGINGLSKAFSKVGGMSMGFLSSTKVSVGFNQASVNLKYMNSGNITSTIAQAMGYFNGGEKATAQSGGVNTFAGAQAMIDIAESAQKTLDRIRSDLGSVQNQLVSTINNITVTRVNVASAESQIRDVDFAEESANFSKFNILAQSGSYAMSQANTVQQNVLRLLQ